MLYTISEAAELLGVSATTLRRWEKAGKIQFDRTEGGQRRVSHEEVEQILGYTVPEEKKSRRRDPLREKKNEIKSLKLDIEREKVSRRLEKVQGNEVDKARNELAIMKINRQKERLLAGKRKEEQRRRARELRKQWLEQWVQVGYRMLDPVPYVFPQWGLEPKVFPLSLKVELRNAITSALAEVSIDEPEENILHMVEKIADEKSIGYFAPQWKREYIENALTGLQFPKWVPSDLVNHIKGHIREVLNSEITGTEMPEDVDTRAIELADEITARIDFSQGKGGEKSLSEIIEDIQKNLHRFR